MHRLPKLTQFFLISLENTCASLLFLLFSKWIKTLQTSTLCSHPFSRYILKCDLLFFRVFHRYLLLFNNICSKILLFSSNLLLFYFIWSKNISTKKFVCCTKCVSNIFTKPFILSAIDVLILLLHLLFYKLYVVFFYTAICNSFDFFYQFLVICSLLIFILIEFF